ncbi:MAG TPA: ABC transporter substrate-binding protein, partial [Candidatus Limnocylindrales bacterium]|nr:ABC transporter substrate-binding protein [Candidatus Limnocylindrales bacterium]
MSASFPFRRSQFILIVVLVAVAAACTSGAAPTVSIPADATSSAQPAETGTPPPEPTAAATFPPTLTDDEGTEVELAAEPQRIVSLTPAATETLFALGVGDRLVGKVEDFSLYPPEAAAIPDVARFGEVDVERIVSLEADL